MELTSRIYVAGGDTLIGTALRECLRTARYTRLVGEPPNEPDLTYPNTVTDFFASEKPEYVFVAAGASGGILANRTYPALLMRDNLLSITHILHAAYCSGVTKLLYLASSCSYPRLAPQPLRVESLMTGPLESTSEAYALAKLAGLKLCQAYRQQYGSPFITAIPANVFGPHDDFSAEDSHVIPALIRKIHMAHASGQNEVRVWGTGRPRREFIYSRDLADACLFIMNNYDAAEPINVGSGIDRSISDVAHTIAEVVGYHGWLRGDTKLPDGMTIKVLDSTPLKELGWRRSTFFRNALVETYNWFLHHSIEEMKPTPTVQTTLDWPLMRDNITRGNLDTVIEYLKQDDPILTQSNQVRAFEKEWSDWLGVKHSVFVNSGSSANLLTLAALKHLYGGGQIIVPPLTWVSDIAAVLHCGFEPIFVDIDPRTLGMDSAQVIAKLTPKTRAVFLTHMLGYNALTQEILQELEQRNIPLIEDVCESHGATFQGRRLGSFGLASNFSFYYAHHLSTIEGGMVCTNDENFYEIVRMLRSHGMVREMDSLQMREEYYESYPDLSPDFVFAYPAWNMRSTEINAIIGRAQLPRLEENIRQRTANLHLFLANLNPEFYQTDFATEGSSNYALTLVLKRPDESLWHRVVRCLKTQKVEFRRGLSGGGNQLRQPYLRRLLPPDEYKKYPHVEHFHFYSCYIGNYPTLSQDKILQLCTLLNKAGE